MEATAVKRKSRLACIGVALWACGGAWGFNDLQGQAPRLSFADSVDIRSAQIKSLLEDQRLDDSLSVRIWLRPWRPVIWEGDSPPPAPFVLTNREATSLLERFRGIVRTEEFNELFACDPDFPLRLPGSGCPIRDSGVVIALGPMTVGDSVSTSGQIYRTVLRPTPTARGGRFSTGMAFCTMVLRKTAAGWQVTTTSCGRT
jgi:hypothetical protein